MALDGFGACCFIGIIDLTEVFWLNNVAGVEHYGNVIELELWQVVDGLLQGLGT